jgi:transposase
MDDVCGVPMRVGTISQSEKATTAVVAAPVEEARTYVHEQQGAYPDETSGRQGDKRAWVWVAVTSGVTVFLVRLSRGGQVARELLGEGFRGIVVTDRSSASNCYPVRWRQLCWAHVLRDFEATRDRGGASEEMGDALLGHAHQMFGWWHRVREGTWQRATFRSYMRPLRQEVERLLEAGSRCGVPTTAGTCREILQRREAL